MNAIDASTNVRNITLAFSERRSVNKCLAVVYIVNRAVNGRLDAEGNSSATKARDM